jgi:hypothetical protein
VENFAKLAKEKGLAVKETAPFDREDGPKDLAVGLNFVKASFALTTNDPVAGPLDGEDGAYVIAMDKMLPSEIPPLDKIRDEVTADYKYSEAIERARDAGEAFSTALTNGLAAGKTFSAVCGEMKVLPVLLPPFSLSTSALPQVEEHANLMLFKQAAFSVNAGKSSEFVPTTDGGFVLSVRMRLPLDETRMKADLPKYTASIRQTRQNEAFNLWFRKQIEQDSGLRRKLEDLAKNDRQLSGTPQ